MFKKWIALMILLTFSTSVAMAVEENQMNASIIAKAFDQIARQLNSGVRADMP